MTTDARFWDGIAEQYAQKPVANPTAYENKLAITRSHLSPHDQVLDIGCGTGSTALALAPGVAHVHAVDSSSEMVRIANAKARAGGVDNVTFHTAAFADVSMFAAESFDMICAYSLLHLVDDLPAVLAKIDTLLKPGGVFVSSTVCLGANRVFYTPLLAVMRWLGKAPMVRLIRHSDLRQAMHAAGFRDLSGPDVGAKKSTAFLVAHKR